MRSRYKAGRLFVDGIEPVALSGEFQRVALPTINRRKGGGARSGARLAGAGDPRYIPGPFRLYLPMPENSTTFAFAFVRGKTGASGWYRAWFRKEDHRGTPTLVFVNEEMRRETRMKKSPWPTPTTVLSPWRSAPRWNGGSRLERYGRSLRPIRWNWGSILVPSMRSS
jgi:hypothetical protein